MSIGYCISRCEIAFCLPPPSGLRHPQVEGMPESLSLLMDVCRLYVSMWARVLLITTKIAVTAVRVAQLWHVPTKALLLYHNNVMNGCKNKIFTKVNYAYVKT